MLKKQLEAGKLVAHGQVGVSTGGQVNGMVMVDNGMFQKQQQVQSQQQEGQRYGGQQELNSGNEMYANFQQAQMQTHDDGGQQVSLYVVCDELLKWDQLDGMISRVSCQLRR